MSKSDNNLDEDCSVERVKSAIKGDKMMAKLDDAMRRAIPLAEQNKISPLAMVLIGTIWRDRERGKTLVMSHVKFMKSHNFSDEMDAKWDAAIAQLTEHKLLPE
jgi:hypothetical protein